MNRVIQKTSMVIALILLSLSLLVVPMDLEDRPLQSIIIPIILSFILAFAFGKLMVLVYKRSTLLFYIILFLFAVILKVLWVNIYSTYPSSDYWLYQSIASNRANGISWKELYANDALGNGAMFPHILNFSTILSYIYRVFGISHITGQHFNIIIAFFSGVLLFKFIKLDHKITTAVWACTIFLSFPAYWIFSCILGTENIFLFFVLLFMLYFRKYQIVGKKYYLIVSLISIVASNLIRPIGIIWILTYILTMIFIVPRDKKTVIKNSVILLATFIISSVAIPKIQSGIYGFDISSGSAAYGLAVGTSWESGGQYSQEIMDEVKEDLASHKSFSAIDKKLYSRVENNLTKIMDSNRLFSFLKIKLSKLMSETYGYRWYLHNIDVNDPTQPSERLFSHGELLIVSSIGYFFLMLFISIIWLGKNIFSRERGKEFDSVFLLSILINGIILGSMLLEVQGRYHVSLYIPLCIYAGSAFSWLDGKVTPKFAWFKRKEKGSPHSSIV